MKTLHALLITLSVLSSSLLQAQSTRPNILLFIADDVSYPHMGAYGCSWVETPGFDRIAKEGLLFHAAYTPNAKCAPSRSCLITGRNSWQLGEGMNHWCNFPTEFKSVYEVLADAGYHVGYTGKGWGPGQPGEIEGKRRKLTGKGYQNQKLEPLTSGISNNDYAANFEDFLKDKQKDQPFCFWFGSTEPHRGYEFQSGVNKGGKKLSDIDQVPPYWPDNDSVRHDMLDYALELEDTDAHLLRMLQELEDRGELANTLVIALADHGMPFPRVKANAYDPSNHIPLAIMWPKQTQAAGRDIHHQVNVIDLAPTMLAAAGIKAEASGMAALSGHSLLPMLQDSTPEPVRSYTLIGKERHDVGRPHDWGYPIRGIHMDSLLYIYNFEPDRWPAGNPETGYLACDGGATKTWLINHYGEPGLGAFWEFCLGKRPVEELYDLRQDPFCLQNLADIPAYGLLKMRLQQQMIAALTAEGDWRMQGRGHAYEQFPYTDPAHRGFYERYMRGEEMPFTGWVSPGDYHDLEGEKDKTKRR